MIYEYPAYTDTHAHVLFDIGRKEEAIKWQEKAIELSRYSIGGLNNSYVEELEKMKNGIL